MPLPFFYTDPISATINVVVLNEENSKHCIQVLRMQQGEKLKLTDGLGNIFLAEITEPHKKKCVVDILERTFVPKNERTTCIAVSPVKNNSRFEWFLEKAAEVGVSEIVPLLCDRSEKQIVKQERLKGILISAMLQSQQAWLPILHEPTKFEKFVSKDTSTQKFIAHCENSEKNSFREFLNNSVNQPINQSTILIGPEGDFTSKEIELAIQKYYTPVALGDTRLRTETAAVVAAVLLNID